MFLKQMWFFYLIINVCKSTTNSEDASNNVKQILEHLFAKSSPDNNLIHNVSYLPQIFQGTIILNINYPESKSAINIYNSPKQKNNLCNCNSNMANNQPECNCNEQQNFSNFAEDAKDFKNNANKELGHDDLLTNEEIINSNDNINQKFKNNMTINLTDRLLLHKMNLTIDQDYSNITLKGHHDDNNNNASFKINKSSLNNSTQFSVANKAAENLLNMAVDEINKNQIKVTKKIDRLRDLTKTNATVSYLQQKKNALSENNVPARLSVNLFENNSSNANVLTKEAIIQESIINFQQYIPPLLNNSFAQNISDSEVNSGLNILCPFPAKCVYLMYCTVDAKISNSPVILNVEEEKLRNKLPDCVDKFTGRTGKCCVDPISGD